MESGASALQPLKSLVWISSAAATNWRRRIDSSASQSPSIRFAYKIPFRLFGRTGTDAYVEDEVWEPAEGGRGPLRGTPLPRTLPERVDADPGRDEDNLDGVWETPADEAVTFDRGVNAPLLLPLGGLGAWPRGITSQGVLSQGVSDSVDVLCVGISLASSSVLNDASNFLDLVCSFER